MDGAWNNVDKINDREKWRYLCIKYEKFKYDNQKDEKLALDLKNMYKNIKKDMK